MACGRGVKTTPPASGIYKAEVRFPTVRGPLVTFESYTRTNHFAGEGYCRFGLIKQRFGYVLRRFLSLCGGAGVAGVPPLPRLRN